MTYAHGWRRGWIRAVATLLALGAGGCLLWFAAQSTRDSNGGYWAAMRLVGRRGSCSGSRSFEAAAAIRVRFFVLVFLPVLVVAGWVLLAYAAQRIVVRAITCCVVRRHRHRRRRARVGTWARRPRVRDRLRPRLVAEPAPAGSGRGADREPRPTTTAAEPRRRRGPGRREHGRRGPVASTTAR